MFELYEKYLEVIDKYLEKCFDFQSPFIHCKIGCTDCCETGEYPFSRLEAEYLMAGFPQLQPEIQNQIKNNIKYLLRQKSECKGRFLHRCPFLIDKKCVLYERRGLTCRAFGLACFETVDGKKVVKLPECSRIGLNYSEVLDSGEVDMSKFQLYGVTGPINHSLSLNYFEHEILKGVTDLEFGEIRPILEWFNPNH